MYRSLSQTIVKNIDSKEVLILLGPRQVGKTTLLKNLLKERAIYIDLDDKVYRDFFDSLSIAKYRSYINSQLSSFHNEHDKIILILDEAQRLKDPGLAAKIFYDEIENVKVILTGSATLDIRKKTSESLAGRKTTLNLFPLSFQEYLVQRNLVHEDGIHQFPLSTTFSYDDITAHTLTEEAYERMRIGLYPGVVNTQAESYLQELVDAVILKDIFYLNLVKNTSGLVELLKLLASFIGQPINISDLSKRLGIARQTITDYIQILEKSYIIFTLSPYTKEREDEISKYEIIYFYDLGIRNALLNDFRPVTMRTDFNKIFANFIIAEIKKLNAYYSLRYKFHYWKTTQGSEVALVLEKDTKLEGFSIDVYKESFSKGFENTYPESGKHIINLNNYLPYLV